MNKYYVSLFLIHQFSKSTPKNKLPMSKCRVFFRTLSGIADSCSKMRLGLLNHDYSDDARQLMALRGSDREQTSSL